MTAVPDDAARGGLPLVPHTVEQLEEVRRMNELIGQFMPAVPTFHTDEGLAALRSSNGFFGTPYDGPVEVGELPGPAGPVPCRTFVPDGRPPRAVVLDIHGGGWCIGAAESGDATNRELADAVGAVVVSIDYRLAPEHPWPAGADDCEAAARWLLDEAPGRWGCDRLVLSGGSAGAHLSAVTLLRLRDAGRSDRVAAANLVFGAFDLGMTPTQRLADDALVIPLESLQACYRHTFPGLDREDRRHASISPLYADLTGLCPALLTIGTGDPLLDDSLFLAARWRAAGNDARLDLYPECPHGFPGFPIALAAVARRRIIDWLDEVLAAGER